MKRSVDDIRKNMDYVGCDNATALEMCDEIGRLQLMATKETERCMELEAKLERMLYDAQGNGFIGDNVDDAIAWATRQMGESFRLRKERDRAVAKLRDWSHDIDACDLEESFEKA